jgi:NADPH:quinone reductase
MEFSGHVHATGAGVDLAVGAPVFGVVNPRRPEGGAHSEFVVVPAASVALLDGDSDLVRAATIPMNGLTALMALEILGLRAGDSVLVTGGTGILGGSAIRLARAAGLRVLAGGRPEDAALLQDLGAQDVLPRGDGLVEAARALLPDGVDGMIDGALIGTSVAGAVRDGGSAVSLRLAHPVVDARLRCECVSVIAGMERQDLLARLADLLGRGELVPRIAPDGILPFAKAADAFRRTAAGGFRGRIVLSFKS